MVIDSMVASGQLDESLRQKVREAVLKRHHHQNERKLSNRFPLAVRSLADIGKKHSEPMLLERSGEGFLRTPPHTTHCTESSAANESDNSYNFIKSIKRSKSYL